MAVQLNIPYETLIELVEQLPIEQQQTLLERLLEKKKERPLSKEEKLELYHASILSIPVKNEPSIRREDWYGDDGR
jgi:hypothetical protein